MYFRVRPNVPMFHRSLGAACVANKVSSSEKSLPMIQVGGRWFFDERRDRSSFVRSHGLAALGSYGAGWWYACEHRSL